MSTERASSPAIEASSPEQAAEASGPSHGTEGWAPLEDGFFSEGEAMAQGLSSREERSYTERLGKLVRLERRGLRQGLALGIGMGCLLLGGAMWAGRAAPSSPGTAALASPAAALPAPSAPAPGHDEGALAVAARPAEPLRAAVTPALADPGPPRIARRLEAHKGKGAARAYKSRSGSGGKRLTAGRPPQHR